MSGPSQAPAFARRAAAAAPRLRTLRDLVRWGASRFAEAELHFGHGTDNPIDEATVLVLHALALEPGPPAELWGAAVDDQERDRVLELFRRRIEERIPAPYLTGEAWFAGLSFVVDERVLVPRSPLAEWIERGFEPWVEAGAVHAVADVGTGSGCIAVACAVHMPWARVDALDIDEGALEVAALNVARHGVGDRVRVRRSDLLAHAAGPYDVIVSNPPYVDRAALESMPPEYRREPRRALAAGEDGLDCVRRLLAEAGEHLSADGILVVEVGASRAALEASYPDTAFAWLELERGGESVFLLTAEQLRGGGPRPGGGR